MADKLHHLNAVGDSLRRWLCSEQRSAIEGWSCLLVPACDPVADMGLIILQPDQAHAMSGSNAMCAATALLETGMIPRAEPDSLVTCDTAAGLVRTTATCEGGKVVRVAPVPTRDGIERQHGCARGRGRATRSPRARFSAASSAPSLWRKPGSAPARQPATASRASSGSTASARSASPRQTPSRRASPSPTPGADVRPGRPSRSPAQRGFARCRSLGRGPDRRPWPAGGLRPARGGGGLGRSDCRK
jgi:hypothetical protein